MKQESCITGGRRLEDGAEQYEIVSLWLSLTMSVEAQKKLSRSSVEAGRRTSAGTVFLRLLCFTISAEHCQLPAHDHAESPG